MSRIPKESWAQIRRIRRPVFRGGGPGLKSVNFREVVPEGDAI